MRLGEVVRTLFLELPLLSFPNFLSLELLVKFEAFLTIMS
jgi:hypothetical protein